MNVFARLLEYVPGKTSCLPGGAVPVGMRGAITQITAADIDTIGRYAIDKHPFVYIIARLTSGRVVQLMVADQDQSAVGAARWLQRELRAWKVHPEPPKGGDAVVWQKEENA